MVMRTHHVIQLLMLHAFVLRGVTCFTSTCAAPNHDVAGLKRRKTMTEKPPRQIPLWLTIDVLIILVGLVIITGGIWITTTRIF
jgi:hypothetical protein